MIVQKNNLQSMQSRYKVGIPSLGLSICYPITFAVASDFEILERDGFHTFLKVKVAVNNSLLTMFYCMI